MMYDLFIKTDRLTNRLLDRIMDEIEVIDRVVICVTFIRSDENVTIFVYRL